MFHVAIRKLPAIEEKVKVPIISGKGGANYN
jgi:hypothetical protein